MSPTEAADFETPGLRCDVCGWSALLGVFHHGYHANWEVGRVRGALGDLVDALDARFSSVRGDLGTALSNAKAVLGRLN